MKRYIILLMCIAIGVSACEKVIDVELGDADKNIVIDAKLYNGQNEFIVVITKTLSFFEQNDLSTIDDATVRLTSLGGVDETLIAGGDGFYILPGFEGIPGETYTLTVNAEGKEYQATSFMPEVPTIDSTYYVFEPGDAFLDEGYDIFNLIQDVEGERGNYRLWYSIDDTLQNNLSDFLLFDDEFIEEGIIFQIPIFTRRFEAGDRVGIILGNMDDEAYLHYETFINLVSDQGGGNSAAPANPETNWSNGALGVFAAFSTTTSYIELPE